VKGTRLAKLERWARERPCPLCGRTDVRQVTEQPAPARLDAAEQHELTLLLKVASTPPCVRCGRAGHDIARLTDDQKRRTATLLRTLLDSSGRRA
jgi:hypothetical protein